MRVCSQDYWLDSAWFDRLVRRCRAALCKWRVPSIARSPRCKRCYSNCLTSAMYPPSAGTEMRSLSEVVEPGAERGVCVATVAPIAPGPGPRCPLSSCTSIDLSSSTSHLISRIPLQSLTSLTSITASDTSQSLQEHMESPASPSGGHNEGVHVDSLGWQAADSFEHNETPSGTATQPAAEQSQTNKF